MTRTTFFIFLLICGFGHGQAWAGGSSYSSYGYGLVEYSPNVRSGGMGRTGIAVPSLYTVNVFNPAALMGITMVRADASAFYEQLQVRDRNATASSNVANFGHLAFAIPFGKRLAMAVTLARYTRIGYNYSFNSTDDLGQTRTEKLEGSGGTELLGFTVAGRPHPNWAGGISFQYALGSTNQSWQVNWNSPDISNTDNRFTNNLSGFRWVLGALYSKEPYRLGTFVALSGPLNNELTQTRANEDTVLSANRKSDFPVEIGLGASYAVNARYTISSDVVYTLWDDVRFAGADPGYRNTVRIGVGVERSPKADLSSHFLETLYYRGGLFAQNLYARTISGKFASEYFVTAGVGIPFFKGRNMIDLSLELGQRGRVSSNYVRETVFRFCVSVSGGEHWFQNRKKRSQENK